MPATTARPATREHPIVKILPYVAKGVRSVMPTDPDIEDVIQIAAFNLLRSGFDINARNPGTYAYIAGRNTAYTELRKRMNYRRYVYEPDTFDEHAYLSSPSPRQNFIDEMMQQESQDTVNRAIAQLPPLFRGVIDCLIADMPYDAIAQKLNINLGTVKSRIFRAKAHLKALLEQE